MAKTEGVIEIPGEKEKICKDLIGISKKISEHLELLSGILGNHELIEGLIKNLSAIIEGCEI